MSRLTLAVETELRRRERAAIDAEFALMATDPEYQAETAQIMRDFDGADRETWAKELMATDEHG